MSMKISMISYTYSCCIEFMETGGYFLTSLSELTHCGLAMPCGIIDLEKHWFRQWYIANSQQAITWTDVNFYQYDHKEHIWMKFQLINLK